MNSQNKTCNEIKFGTGDCGYNIMLPYYVRSYGDIPIEPEAKYVSIDKCLIKEIIYLWELGIKTTGCCCGHGDRTKAFIGVKEEYISLMKELGYEVYYNSCRPNDEDSFIPTTNLRYGKINKGFDWWNE